jgi:hypothetical protein
LSFGVTSLPHHCAGSSRKRALFWEEPTVAKSELPEEKKEISLFRT